MADKTEAIAALDAKYHEFQSKISGLTDDAFSEDWLGEWNLSEVLAHMAGWFGEMTAGISRVSRGERPTPEGVDYSDSDAWNARFAAGVSPGRGSLTTFEAAYAAYRSAAEALPADQFGVDPEKGRPKIGNRLLQGAGIGHFEEHQPQLDAWLASRG